MHLSSFDFRRPAEDNAGDAWSDGQAEIADKTCFLRFFGSQGCRKVSSYPRHMKEIDFLLAIAARERCRSFDGNAPSYLYHRPYLPHASGQPRASLSWEIVVIEGRGGGLGRGMEMGRVELGGS